MGVLDLSHQLDRMINERRGVSDRTNSHSDLGIMRQNLSDMLAIRSGNKSLTSKTCPSHQRTVCTKHLYPSYESITGSATASNALSLGDIDKALDKITYCTCNSRMIGGCDCRTKDAGSRCSCHSRVVEPCVCRARDGGKYHHENDCSCRGRSPALCSCQARNSAIDCTCDARCSCNVVKEFSYTKYNPKCVCNTRVVQGCMCNVQKLNETWSKCVCLARCSCNAKSVMGV